MTISTEVRKAGPFIGNDSASVFPFSFKVFKAADLIVVRRQDNIGEETTLVLDSDYHVTLNGNQDTTPGGVVTLVAGALASGFTLVVSSELPYLQPTDLTNQGGFYPKVITNALDRLTIFCQQLVEITGRTLKLPITAPTNISTEIPLPNPAELIAWDETGTKLTTVSPQSLVTSIAYGSATADLFAGDGVTTTFPLSTNPASVNNLDVSVGGFSQRPVQDGIGDYSWNGGATITFVEPPPAPTVPGDKNVLVRYMQAIPVSDSEALHAQAREALRRSYAEAGFNLVDGSFETGGTLTSITDVLLLESAGTAYAWTGAYPPGGYDVAPGIDPTAVVGFTDKSSTLNIASKVGYQRALPVGYSGTVQNYLDDLPGVNLWEFADLVIDRPTADNPATWDWTPAWVAAKATGRKIIVPEGKYRAANVPFTSDTVIVCAGGRSRKTELCLITEGASYFLDSSAGNTSQCHISGVYATTEVIGGAFLRKTTRSAYLAYQTYDDIEVSAAIEVGFDGFFIYGDWDRCRFGYYGTIGAGGHCSIKSYPATAAQGNQTNLNRVARSQFFRANVQSVYLEHGNEWFFDYCDFEQITGKAVIARGVVGGHFNGCWFESITGSNYVDIAVSAAPQNCQGWSARNCKFIGIGFTGAVFSMDRNSSLLAENNVCERMDGAATFKTGSGIVTYKNNALVSGTATNFFSDLNSGSRFIDNQLLMWGRNSCPAARFTNSGFTSIADGASLAGGDNTARFTLSASSNVAYYSLPTKLLDYIKGRRVAITAMGSFVASTGGDTINLYAWDSVTPGFSNPTSGSAISTTTNTALAKSTVTVDVSSGSTSLSFGLRAGGGASGAVFVLEQLSLTLLT